MQLKALTFLLINITSHTDKNTLATADSTQSKKFEEFLQLSTALSNSCPPSFLKRGKVSG